MKIKFDLNKNLLKKNFNKIDFTKKNSLNININDNKKMVTLFGGKYINFLLQLKGVSINNKIDLIQILNSKPRSFLTNLIILVKKFKYYEYLLNKKMKEINPKTMILLSKKTTINHIESLELTNTSSELKLKAIKENTKKQNLSLKKFLFDSNKLIKYYKKILQNILFRYFKIVSKKKFLSKYNNKSLFNKKNNNNNLYLLKSKNRTIIKRNKIHYSILKLIKYLRKNIQILSYYKLLISNNYNNMNLINNIIINKTIQLKNTLNNNKLSIPLNLLKPLIDVNKSITSFTNKKNLLKKNFNLIELKKLSEILSTPLGPILFKNKLNLKPIINKDYKLEELDIFNFLSKSQKLNLLKFIKNNLTPIYINKINKLNCLITEYHKNINNIRKTKITYTKYFQLITARKSVKPFNQNIKYNFNKFNNINKNKNLNNIITLLEFTFRSMSCLISKPIFMETPHKININIFYFFIPGKENKITKLNKLKKLKDQNDSDISSSLNSSLTSTSISTSTSTSTSISNLTLDSASTSTSNLTLDSASTSISNLTLDSEQAQAQSTKPKILTSLNGIEIKNFDPKVTRNLYNILNEKLKKKLENSKKEKETVIKILHNKNIHKYFLTEKNFNKLNYLCDILSRIFKKPVELDLTPLKLPFFDDNILVKSIGIMCNKIPVRTFFNFIFRKASLYSKIRANQKYRYSITRSYLAGIKFKVGGRLMTQKAIPRLTSRIMQRGAIKQSKVTYVD